MHLDRDVAEEAGGEQPDNVGERAEAHSEQGQPRQTAERAYGGDPDAAPGITEREVEAGMERDQAEG